jgi:hypothetical protein
VTRKERQRTIIQSTRNELQAQPQPDKSQIRCCKEGSGEADTGGMSSTKRGEKENEKKGEMNVKKQTEMKKFK